MHIIGFIIFGLIVGAIAKLIMPGKDPGGFIITAILGMVGSVIGGWIGASLGWGNTGLKSWILAIIGAIILLALYRLFAGRRTT